MKRSGEKVTQPVPAVEGRDPQRGACEFRPSAIRLSGPACHRHHSRDGLCHILRAALLLFTALATPARATAPDTFSPVVSYQFLDSLDDSPATSPIVSPVVSYQYYDWLGDANVTFQYTPNVSYRFNGAPQILTQPLAQVLKVGQTANFSVSADGSAPMSYQWQFNGVNLAGGTGPSISVPNLQLAYSGKYSVTVQNAYGSAVSNDARLTVYLSPSTQQPVNPTLTTATGTLSTAQTTKPTAPVSTQLKWFNAATNQFESVPAQSTLAGKMTIVLTHGWKSSPSGTAASPEWPIKMARALAPAYGGTANVLAWDWQTDAAGNPSGLASLDPAPVAARTVPQGMALGNALMNALGSAYDKNIHFIGHSFGTAVNCAAANYVHGDKRPRGETRPATQKYASYNTHMTLFDEAEMAAGFKGLHVALDIPMAGFDEVALNDAVEQLNNFTVEVIPKHWGWIDNYVSEVGYLHPEAVNVMLWRKNYVNVVFAPHGYSYEWYQDTITRPGESLVGHRWSFERNTLFQGPMAPSYYLQSLDLNGSEMTVSKINVIEAEALSWGRVVAYPTLKAAQGMDAGGKYVQKQLSNAGDYIYEKASAVSTKVGAAYLNGIQYAGNMLANFVEGFSTPKGTPVFVGSAGSTPAYILAPSQTLSGNQQADWKLNFSIQPGAPQPQQLNVPMTATAITSAAAAPGNAVFTLIPIHVPNEAAGVSFEYKMDGTAVEDFMTMGIGTGNNYTMEAKYEDDGQWNATPVILVTDFRGQDVQFAFALNGTNGPPAGKLSIRNIHFYVPPRPQLILQIAKPQMTVSWPLSALEWTVESTTDLSNPNGWQPTATAPLDSDYFHTQTFDISTTGKAFFRLKK